MIEDFNGIFQERICGIVRDGLLAMFEQEVTDLCGPTYRPTASKYRRAGSEMVKLDTTEGRERFSKSRVRVMKEDGKESEVRLKSYAAAKKRKGMFDEVLEAMCHGASGNGVGKMLGVSASTDREGWKPCHPTGISPPVAFHRMTQPRPRMHIERWAEIITFRIISFDVIRVGGIFAR